MGTKNAELNADFKSIEKVAKRLDLKNLEGRELTHTVLKDEKYHNSCTFMPVISFVGETACNLFNELRISNKFFVFIPILNIFCEQRFKFHVITFRKL
jgi:hypothetical protein